MMIPSPLGELLGAAVNMHWALHAQGSIHLSATETSLAVFLVLIFSACIMVRIGVEIRRLWRFISGGAPKAAPSASQTSSRPGCSCSKGISQRGCPHCGCGGDEGIPYRETLGRPERQSFQTAFRGDALACGHPDGKLLPAEATQ
jgi:hypothetical protein